MKKIKYFFEYLPVLILDTFFSVLPLKIAIGLGENLGSLAGKIFYKRSELAFQNIKKSFPNYENDHIWKIVESVWKNVGRTAVEFIRFSKLGPHNYRDYFTFEGVEYIQNAIKENKGIIFITLHLSNWEIGGRVTAFLIDKEITAIARPIKNPFVEKWVQGKRSAARFKIILHRQAVRESLRVLQNKGFVAILPDQNLYKGGTFVSFFGRTAATTTLPALLYSKTKSPVILGYCLRNNGKFKMVYERLNDFPDIPDKIQRHQKYTQIISNQIEKVIKKYPDRWFWLHNRWKNQPKP